MKKATIWLGLVLVLLGAGCQKTTTTTTQNKNTNPVTVQNRNVTTNTTTNSSPSATMVNWDFNGTTWSASGTPPDCPDPLSIQSPVNVAAATSILYPGQTRGGNYKAHGGFRFDTSNNSDITVTVPMDARVVQGSRYIELGETQYLFDLQSPCGLRFRFDHLLTLSPAFQALAALLPTAQQNNSRTTRFETPLSVKAGDVIATAVGFGSTSNVSLDFGVYDLRQPNEASTRPVFQAAHGMFRETAYYGICWLELLPAADAAKVKALPAGDQQLGKTSDYCE